MVRQATWYLALLFPIAAAAQTITGAEYFFDTDPGQGHGIVLEVPEGATTTAAFTVDASALAPGFHTLNLRCRDANGIWGIAAGRLLFVNDGAIAPPDPAAAIVAAEFFFDTDPGQGLAQAVSVPSGNTSSNSVVIDASALAPGFHTLNVRYRDADGRWGLAAGRLLFVNEGAVAPPGAAPDIVAAEYFIDTDPGQGDATAIPVPAGPTSSTAFTVDASALAAGFHTLNVRYRDAFGVWSITKPYLFNIFPTTPGEGYPPAAEIAAAEYYVDVDPGVGMAQALVVPQGASTNAQLLIDVSGATIGNHFLGVRLKAADGTWGHARVQPFTIGTPPVPANDLCSQATTIAVQPPATCPAGSVEGTTLGATSTGSIACAAGTPADVWYSVDAGTAESIGVTLVATTAGGMGLRVLDGCSGNTIYCGTGNAHSFSVVPSTVYLLQVFSQAQGTFTICAFEDVVQEDCLGVLGGTALPGTSCDDGNAATIDDVYQSNCTCAGTDCIGVVGGTTGPGTTCLVGTGPTGISFHGSYDASCECSWLDCNGVPNGPDFPGQACNDGDASTPSSILDTNCDCIPYDCQGTPNGPYMVGAPCAAGAFPAGAIMPTINASCNCTWTDCLGVVNGTSLPGSACNDGNPATSNDVIGADCQCAGVIIDCLGMVNGSAMPGTSCTIGSESGTWSSSCVCIVPRPDLTVADVTATPTLIAPGDSVEVFWTIGNSGAAPAYHCWTERIQVRNSAGQNTTLLRQVSYSAAGSLAPGTTVARSTKVLVPVQFTVGDQCVFRVEITPGAGVTEVSGGAANNNAVQQTSWNIVKLLALTPAVLQISEGATGTMTVRRTGAITSAQTVTITPAAPERFTIPPVAFTAGQSTRSFTITAIDNTTLEGLHESMITASASGMQPGSATLRVPDNEVPALSFSGFPTTVAEGNSYTFHVGTNLAPTAPLTVTLTSSNNQRFPLPSSVVIPAGSTSAPVTVNLAQDNTPELNITVTVQAGASGHTPANTAALLTDDDVPGLELLLSTDTVSETGGIYAVNATLRRMAGSSPIAFNANVSASLANTLILPSTLSLAAGQQQITFNIGVVDNTLDDGYRNVTITAALVMPSCGCGAPPTSAGHVTAGLVVVDNDGPALTATPTPLTLAEGQSPAGQLRVQRNTPTTTALTVSLTSSELNEATVPASVTIPIGSSFVDVPITTINDGVSDGSKIVYFNAHAAGFSPGIAWAMVTDVNKPDLRIVARNVTSTTVPVLGGLGYEVSVTNSGFATAPSGVLVRGYLSTNTTIDASDVVWVEQQISAPLPAGDTITLQGVAIIPDLPGDRKLLFMVNPLSTITELLHTNNTALPVSLDIRPSYSATATVAQDFYFRGQSIPVTGSAQRLDGSPAANAAVEVYVITSQNLRREVMATTDASGAFTATFVPLTNEVGHFTVGAAFPDLNETDAQDAFDILGVRVNNGALPQFMFTFGDTLQGNMAIRNQCAVPLPNVTIAPVALPNGAVINFGTIPLLGANANGSLPYLITGTAATNGNNYQNAELKVASSLGDIQPCYINYYCQTPQGHISATPSSITTTVSTSMGERFVELQVVNSGAGPTGNISLSLPQVPWLNAVTPLNMSPIAAGDTALVILRFLASSTVPFNAPVTGTVAINSQNGNNIAVPFSFTKVSETQGDVVVEVENQFTYFAEGQPKVEGALVKIRNYYTGVVYAQGLTGPDGLFIAANVPEGTHRITVEKAQHITYNGEVTIDPGASVMKPVFLVYQAVTFSWSVVPTQVEDSYTVTLTTNFQTNVPVPVVTIDGPDNVPHVEPNEPYPFNITLQNHGLVTAENVQLILPTTHPIYEFVTSYEPAPLPALSLINVPVIMRVREQSQQSGAQSDAMSVEAVSEFLGMDEASYDPFRDANVSCREVWRTQYEYVCNEQNGFLERSGNMFQYSEQDCDSEQQYGSGGLVGWSLSSIQFGGDWSCAVCPGSNITGASNQPNGTGGGAIRNMADCRLCKEGLTSAVTGVVTDCVKDYVEEKLEEYMEGEDEDEEDDERSDALQQAFEFGYCIGSAYNEDGSTLDYIECIPLPIPPIPPGVECALDVADAALDCAFSSFAVPIGMAMYGHSELMALRSDGDPVFLQMYEDLNMIFSAVKAEKQWADHYYRELGSSDAWNDLFPLLEPTLAAETQFNAGDQAAILSAMAGYELNEPLLQSFFDRWNLTREAWALGIHAPTAEYPDIIVRDSVIAWSDSIEVAIAYADARGYETLGGLFVSVMRGIRSIVNAPDDPNAVCASVTVQFSQQVTMTREAFTGTLVIENGHPTDAMDSLTVDILITDLDDVPSNGLFQINTQSLINLSDVIGTGALDAQDQGTVVFQFIPTNAAAPTVPKQYKFGGSMTYWDPYAEAMTTLPFTPVTLTVNPGPDLMLHYFLERNILGDDALTADVVEPSVPAELAVMVRNDGYGAANNLRISSAQPQIIDNDNGLAVSFQLIGSNLQGQPANLGVTNINFGTIPPLQAKVGQWYLTSSLLGHFSNYDAQVVHNNSFGNPELSLIQGAELHELTRSIRAYGAQDDGITDFLVNDLFDLNDIPDIIYFSQGDSVAPVDEAANGSFSAPVGPPTFTNTLTVTASEVGWNYIKVNDPGNGEYDIVSVTREDGQVIPLNNAWLTFVTLPVQQVPVYEDKFHFVDRFTGLQPVDYTVVWTPKDTTRLRVDTIMGAPSAVTAQQVQQFTVRFNKPVDVTSLTHVDLSLHQGGGPDLMDASVTIQPIDARTFEVDLGPLTNGNGTFSFVVDAAGITDQYGLDGAGSDTVTWTQYHSVPAVEAFLGVPMPALATGYSTISVRFNLPIDASSVTADDFLLLLAGDTINGSVTIDSVSSDLRTFHLSGLGALMVNDGTYTFVVDVPGIRSTDLAHGIVQQQITLTRDNTGPQVTSILTSNTGGLDAQHVTFLDIHLSEAVTSLPTGALGLSRAGTPVSINGVQLAMITPVHWRLGNLGFSTYNEGNYLFTIDNALLSDALGNSGSGTTSAPWSVVRTTTLTISSPSVAPDMGHDATDKITASLALDVGFTLNEGAQQVRVFRVVGANETMLGQAMDLPAGTHTIPVTLFSGGTTTLKITAVALNGISKNIQFNVFADTEPLTAVWNTLPGQVLTAPLGTAHLGFSARILNEALISDALSLTRDGSPLSTTSLGLTVSNHTALAISGLAAVADGPGTYRLRIDLGMLAKHSSGAAGATIPELQWTVVETQQTVKLALKAMLDGPFDPLTGRMHDSLRVAGVIPTTDPYPGAGYTYVNGGPYSVLPSWLNVQGDNAIVDWVVIELRDRNDAGIVVHNQPALLQRDGDVVGTDGTWPIALPAAADAYYIALRHRNHLGAMTASPVTLGTTPEVVDFTLPSTPAHGIDARRLLGTHALLWCGDVTGDGRVQYTGEDNDRDPILQNIGGVIPTNITYDVYTGEDVNMDGRVMYTGEGNDRDPILQVIGGVVPTNVREGQLP